MNLLIIIFVICWLLLCASKLKLYLHMMQLLGYKNDKYLVWKEEHKDKINSSYDKIYASISVVATLFFLISTYKFKINTEIYSVIFIVMTAALIITNKKNKGESKKPLEFTKRAKRLYAMSLSLMSADFLITVGIIYIISKDIIYYFPLWAGIAALLYYFITYYVLCGNYLVEPIEKNINKRFFNEASDKIKHMGNLITVGITGSYGKTSTKFITAAILNEKYKVLKTPESYNTPMGISKVINNELTDAYDVFIAELGATKIGDIEEITLLTNPKIGVITSIGPCHLETFKSIENIMRTKYELIENLPHSGVAIFNYDNEYVKKLADKTFKEKLLYGVDNIEDTDIFAADIRVGSSGSDFTLCINGLGTVEVSTKLLGKHNILNILAGCAVAKVLGLTLKEMKDGISKIESVKHRLELINPGNGVIVIDDAFNSNPEGASAALDVLDEFKNKRKIIVTPGMVELGEIEEKENEKFGEHIARICDIAIIVGNKRTEPIIRGLKKIKFNEKNLYVVSSLNEAIELLKSITQINDVVLFENDLPDTYDE